jgi:hypothetical protein
VSSKILFASIIPKGNAQEEISSFSTTQVHYGFSEMGQSSLLCNLHGFGKKLQVDYNIFNEIFFSCFGY